MTEDQEQARCNRGARCAAWAPGPNGTRLAALSDRPLCPACERAAAATLSGVPALYVRLRGATLLRPQVARGPQVLISRGSPMPLNAAALHLGEHLHWLLTTWEDEVRSIAGLTYPERDGKREARQVSEASALLSAHLSAWIAAPPTELATSRWTEPIIQSGSAAVGDLLSWRASVRALPGFDTDGPRAVRRYAGPCPACGVCAVTHHAGDDLMQCQSCKATQPYLPSLPRDEDLSIEGAA